MGQVLSGELRCEGVRSSRPIRRFIQKRVDAWVSRIRGGAEGPETRYSMTLSREGEGHWVNCRLEIVFMRRVWTVDWSAADLHQAIEGSLRELTRKIMAHYSQPVLVPA